jgi:hypothetical protein
MSQENGFDWELYRSQKFDSVSHPIAPIEIKSISGEWKIFYPIVDSGAVVSVFNEGLFSTNFTILYDFIALTEFELHYIFTDTYMIYLVYKNLKPYMKTIKADHDPYLQCIIYFSN